MKNRVSEGLYMPNAMYWYNYIHESTTLTQYGMVILCIYRIGPMVVVFSPYILTFSFK